jgi:hypothetical protein
MPSPEAQPEGFTITLIPTDREAEDNDWQKECRKLYGQIQNAVKVEEGKVRPLTQKSGADERSGILEFFHQFVAYGISIGGFKAIFELAKTWGEYRKNCEINLAFPDGTQLKIGKVSYDDAVQLWEKHSNRYGSRKLVE